ncbi:MAG: magnesium transporter CorA family protein [Candidatus Diapherotrites archaeon]|nr:magnesium transporter CorA family protein [Candidatus Diapherotrites archaeon]
MAINVLSLEGKAFVEKKLENVPKILKQKKAVLWLDILNPTKEDEEFIRKNFDFESLFISYMTAFNFRPRIIIQPGFVYLSFVSLEYVKGELKKFPLKFFLGKNFLITVRNKNLEEISAAKRISTSIKGFTPSRPELLLYLILDNLTDKYFPILDEIDDSLDVLETALFKNSRNNLLSDLFEVKHVVLEFRKIISPEREAMLFLTNRTNALIDEKSLIYFRDVFDHLIRMQDMLDTYRDLITSALDAYLSIASNKLNEVMKILTIFATLLIPLTVVVGFYGMNIDFPEYALIGKENMFFFILGLMVIISLLMLLFFKRKKWL